MKLKMPLECLSDVSRMSFECLQNALCRDLQAAEQSVYDRRSLSCRYQHVRLQGLKRKCFPHAQSAETIRNRERFDRKMGKNIVHKDMRFVPAPCSPAILYPCDPAPLRPYTLNLTPYTLHLTFSFFHFAILAFRSRQNAKWQEQAGTRCLPTPATFYAFLSFFITRGDTSRRAGPHPPLSPHDVAIPGYGASRRRSAYAACRWVCRSPRR